MTGSLQMRTKCDASSVGRKDRITEDEIKNSAIPMSSKRAIAPGASLRCIVESAVTGERCFDGDFRRLRYIT